MNTDKIEEYKLIREEILHALDTVKSYKNLLYVTVAAILTFAFTQGNPLIFLVPYVVIIPLNLIEQNQISGMLRMGAYLQVFCEDTLDIKWETRLKHYDDVYVTKVKNPAINQYILTGICCSLLAFMNLDFKNIISWEFALYIFIIILFTITAIVIIKRNQIDYCKGKKDYLDRWTYIKNKFN